MPAATAENGSASEEPTTRVAVVEQFCSWSAWRMKSTSRALTSAGAGRQVVRPMDFTIARKFSA